jgi:hypothetical protein
MTLDSILAGLSVQSAVAAIIAAGVLVASVGFTLWAVDMVATFFESSDSAEEGTDEHWRAEHERSISMGDEVECENCGVILGSDAAIHAQQVGYCPKCGENI